MGLGHVNLCTGSPLHAVAAAESRPATVADRAQFSMIHKEGLTCSVLPNCRTPKPWAVKAWASASGPPGYITVTSAPRADRPPTCIPSKPGSIVIRCCICCHCRRFRNSTIICTGVSAPPNPAETVPLSNFVAFQRPSRIPRAITAASSPV